MAELTELQAQLKRRLARLGGQVEALEKMIDQGEKWEKMLELAAAVEGATDQVTADLFEGYLDSLGSKASKDARKVLSLVLKRL
ncbi:MAG: metal-sensing transcriptional repressor [Elusimicrobia bacterium]|jgi:DNA-binding FrmR family transcriptional regulator|nr:metal-sensing transcriptional repressor [Elusimicrobiota bacterium]MBK7545654.1 metal-sensing transcriptional repressor [Elusimicrobiota bacterium]MBK7574916.1 metal-sensing transcriptional repressor [Elusimicrobiota bacterium]MBK7687431.1 metal-sensing transcriptional repressor [Elusimicrobiota bacterium]MBK8125655.1 metal-sensing transcriptional repressor [Elusimicrobiota bacterium]